MSAKDCSKEVVTQIKTGALQLAGGTLAAATLLGALDKRVAAIAAAAIGGATIVGKGISDIRNGNVKKGICETLIGSAAVAGSLYYAYDYYNASFPSDNEHSGYTGSDENGQEHHYDNSGQHEKSEENGNRWRDDREKFEEQWREHREKFEEQWKKKFERHSGSSQPSDICTESINMAKLSPKAKADCIIEASEKGARPCQILNTCQTSNAKTIQKAWRKLLLEVHPDKLPEHKALSEQASKILNNAIRVLGRTKKVILLRTEKTVWRRDRDRDRYRRCPSN